MKSASTNLRPRVPSRQFNREPSQKESWGNVHGHPQFPGLIGQIYFATNDRKLDPDDLAVLEPLSAYFRGYCHRYYRDARKLFKFVGNADHRGSAAYNLQLAQQRSDAVKTFWDSAFSGANYYYSSAESKGESQAQRSDKAGSRRVDIFSSILVSRDESVRFDDEIITGKYRGDRSSRFRFRTILGAGVGIGIIAGGVVTIEIENVRTGRRATYTYGGAGVGGGVTFNRPSDWEEKTLPFFLDVDDFEGNGNVISAGAGRTYSMLSFFGPQERGLTNKPLMIEFKGYDLVVGGNVDAIGYWHRRD